MHVRDLICQRILPDSSLLPGTQTAVPGSGVVPVTPESALSVGMRTGSIGIAERLAQCPAEGTSSNCSDEKQRQEGPTDLGFILLLCFLLWDGLAFFKDN